MLRVNARLAKSLVTTRFLDIWSDHEFKKKKGKQ